MCLAATPLFAKFAVPLILEKLTSTSGSAKKDSMETLALCAPVYGSAALLPNVEELLDSLKIEVFHASDQTLEDAAVESLRSLVGAISTSVVSTGEDPLVKSLKPLLDECLANLQDPESKNSKQTGRILRAVASASGMHFSCETNNKQLTYASHRSCIPYHHRSYYAPAFAQLPRNRYCHSEKGYTRGVSGVTGGKPCTLWICR